MTLCFKRMMYKHHVKCHPSAFHVVLTVWLTFLLLAMATPLFARDNPAPVIDATAQSGGVQQIEDRLAKLERKLDSQTLVEVLTRLDQMQKELQRLAGDVELINHEILGIKKRQRDLYVDLDRRISQIEKAPAGAQQPAGATTAPIPTTSSGTNDGRQAYDKAFRFLKDRRYDKAVSEFKGFVRTYPNSAYANKAQYWLGEANYVQQNYVE